MHTSHSIKTIKKRFAARAGLLYVLSSSLMTSNVVTTSGSSNQDQTIDIDYSKLTIII